MKFNLGKFLAVVSQIGPAILGATPGGEKFAPIVGEIVDAIGAAEQIKGATSAEKRAHVLESAHAAAHTANATGKIELDPAAVDTFVGAGVDNVIKTVHVLEGAKVEKAGTPAAGPAPGTLGSAIGGDPL